MKNSKTVFLIFCVLCLIFPGCEKSDIGQFDEIVIESEDNQYKFKQVSFVISLEDQDYGYLSIEQIDSIEIYVNANYWGTFSSQSIDAIYWADLTVNNLMYSDHQIKYMVIAPYELKTDSLTTVSNYVQYLNDRVVLSPGEYIFEIKRIKFQNDQNEWIHIASQAYQSFSVALNNSSAFIGEFTIPLNN